MREIPKKPMRGCVVLPSQAPSRARSHAAALLAPLAPLSLTLPLTLAASPALAQLNFLNIPDPTPLPSGPLWQRLLLENPLPIAAVLATAGVAVIFIFKQRADINRGLKLGLPAVFAAVALWILASAVQTDREKLKASAIGLVRAVASGDAAATDRALADDALLRTFIDASGLTKDRILERVERDFRKGGSLEVSDFAILEIQATTQGPRDGFVQFKLRATPQLTGGPTFSWWRLDLSRDTDGAWRTTGIDLLESSFGRR